MPLWYKNQEVDICYYKGAELIFPAHVIAKDVPKSKFGKALTSQLLPSTLYFPKIKLQFLALDM